MPERDIHIAKLTTSLSAGRAPDVFLLNYRNMGGFAARGAIEAARGTRIEVARDDFYPLPLEAFEFDGELQCVPQNASSLVVYYNADVFRAAGVRGPAARGPTTSSPRRRAG